MRHILMAHSSEGNLSYGDSPKLLAMMINPSFGICGAIHVLEKISLAFEAEQGWVGWIEANKVRQKMSNHLRHRTIINHPACYIPRFCKPHAIPRVNASQCWTGILFTSHRYTSMTQPPSPFEPKCTKIPDSPNSTFKSCKDQIRSLCTNCIARKNMNRIDYVYIYIYIYHIHIIQLYTKAYQINQIETGKASWLNINQAAHCLLGSPATRPDWSAMTCQLTLQGKHLLTMPSNVEKRDIHEFYSKLQ